jgi:hypothetical protein
LCILKIFQFFVLYNDTCKIKFFSHVRKFYLRVGFVYKNKLNFINKQISTSFLNLLFSQTMSLSSTVNSDTSNSSNISLIEKPRLDTNGKRLTNVNISLYTNVNRRVVLALKVSINFNTYYTFG